MVSFASRLKELRKEKGLTQPELGKSLGVARSTVAVWESGSRLPEMTTLQKICELFDISMPYLLGTTSNRTVLDPKAEMLLELDARDKDNYLTYLCKCLCRLSDDSLEIINGAIQAAMRRDERKALLAPEDLYIVSVQTEWLEDDAPDDDAVLCD